MTSREREDGPKAPEVAGVGFSFDFSTDIPEPVDDRLSIEANVRLRMALVGVRAACGKRPRKSRREGAIAALDGARAVLEALCPAYEGELSLAMQALKTELEDLQAGASPGPITQPSPTTGGHRPDSTATVVEQARAVLAFNWLKDLGLEPHDAAKKVARVRRGSFKEVKEMARYFRRDKRRAEILANLWDELEITQCVDVDAARSDDVIRWLKS